MNKLMYILLFFILIISTSILGAELNYSINNKTSNPIQTAFYTNATSLNGARAVEVANGYAYITSTISDSLTTFSLANISDPIQTSFISNSTSLNGARSVVVLNNHAYVVSSDSNSLTTFSLTDPANPVQTAFISNSTSLNAARSIEISNGYAYVASSGGNSLTTFSLANISKPAQVAFYANTTSLNGSYDVKILNDYLYVVSFTSDSITTFNISNPASPVQVAYYTNSTSLNSARSISILNNYAYVASSDSDAITTFNLSNPANPVQTAYYTNSTSLNGSFSIETSLDYLYVLAADADALTLFNIVNPAIPVQTFYYKNSTVLDESYGIKYLDGYLYVASTGGDSLTIFNVIYNNGLTYFFTNPTTTYFQGTSNITLNISTTDGSVSQALLFFNGTNYGAASYTDVGSNRIFSYDMNISAVGNISYYWNITVSQSTGETFYFKLNSSIYSYPLNSSNTSLYYNTAVYETQSVSWNITIPSSLEPYINTMKLVNNLTEYTSTKITSGNYTTYRATFNIPAYNILKNYNQTYIWRYYLHDGKSFNVTSFITEISTRAVISPRDTYFHTPVYNSVINITNVNTGVSQIINNTVNDVMYINLTSGNYTLRAQAGSSNYNEYSENFTILYDSVKTLNIDFTFNATFYLFDEKTGGVFNVSGATQIRFFLICPENTYQQTITTNNFSIPVSCPYQKFIFSLDYGSSNYYRTLILNPDELNAVNVYLIDIINTATIYSTFKGDDLLAQYATPAFYLYKIIGGTDVLITADFLDIENKMGAYLMENNQYRLVLKSSNNADRSLGTYTADVSGNKLVRLYDISLGSNPNGFLQSVSMGIFNLNNTGGTGIVATYEDTENLTTALQFNIYKDSYSGAVIYTETSAEQTAQFTFDPTPFPTDNLFCEINYSSHGFNSRTFRQQCQSYNASLDTSVFTFKQYVSPMVIVWALIVLISILALYATLQTANIMAFIILGVVAMASVFTFIGPVWGLVALGTIISIFVILKKGDKEAEQY